MLKRATICTAVLLIFVLNLPGHLLAEEIRAHVSPGVVEIGAFFNGTTVFVPGEVRRGHEVLLRISGMDEDFTLKEKGKVLHLLWMNLKAVTVHNAPGAYFVCLSKELAAYMKSHPEKWAAMGIGLDSLKKKISISPESEDKERVLNEFLKLKEAEGVYAVTSGSISYGEESGGWRHFEAALKVPPSLKPGEYMVDIFAVKDGALLDHVSKKLDVKEVGVPAVLSSLATKHGLLYGLMAVVVAIFAGIIMGAVFKGAKGGH